MIAQNGNLKQIIHFLTQRWMFLASSAAVERVFIHICSEALKHDIAIPQKPLVVEFRPCRQIAIIKQRIIELLPKASFIDYIYEAQMGLEANDFIELYVNEQQQCVDKVHKLIDSLESV
jgi:hypothetical protein